MKLISAAKKEVPPSPTNITCLSGSQHSWTARADAGDPATQAWRKLALPSESGPWTRSDATAPSPKATRQARTAPSGPLPGVVLSTVLGAALCQAPTTLPHQGEASPGAQEGLAEQGLGEAPVSCWRHTPPPPRVLFVLCVPGMPPHRGALTRLRGGGNHLDEVRPEPRPEGWTGLGVRGRGPADPVWSRRTPPPGLGPGVLLVKAKLAEGLECTKTSDLAAGHLSTADP